MDTLVLNSDGAPLSHIPLSTRTWRDAFDQVFKGKAKVLKEYDDWIIRSQHLELHVPSIIMTTKYVKYSKQLKYSRNNIYLRDDFTCQLQITRGCKESKGLVKHELLTVDHVVPKDSGGGTSWTNICTACKECNNMKGNDARIVPKKKPHKPSYYELLAKRKNLPIQIKDPEWKYYLDWPEHLVKLVPHTHNLE